MENTLPNAEPENAPDELGTVHYYGTTRLEPFSYARQVAFQRLGVGASSPLESATMLVFLCLQKPSRIDRARGDAGLTAFRLEAAEWAESQGIGVCYTDENGVKRGSKRGHEVMAISDAVWAALAAAESEPDLPADGAEIVSGNA